MTALSQGFMLGLYIMGLVWTPFTIGFALLTALCLAAGYAFIGHGSADARAVRNALQTAARMVDAGVVDRIAAGVAAIGEPAATTQGADGAA